MKINFKALIALGLVIVAGFWLVTSVRTSSYNGANLDFAIGTGDVTVTNPSDSAVPVQLVGTGTRPFTISKTIAGVEGSSTRQGTGSATTQLFEFELPPGTNTFSVVRGANLRLVSDARLEASVDPLSESEARTTMIIAAIVILGGLFFASRATEHRWMSALRRKPAPVEVPASLSGDTKPGTAASNRGRDGRAYSDS